MLLNGNRQSKTWNLIWRMEAWNYNWDNLLFDGNFTYEGVTWVCSCSLWKSAILQLKTCFFECFAFEVHFSCCQVCHWIVGELISLLPSRALFSHQRLPPQAAGKASPFAKWSCCSVPDLLKCNKTQQTKPHLLKCKWILDRPDTEYMHQS